MAKDTVPLKIGIQGGEGSTNERACLFFAEKHGFQDFEIKYLITTEAVLRALNNGEIDYGTFAWKSSNCGLVEETQLAIKKYKYAKIDEQEFQLDHALLCNSKINPNKLIRIFSHPQALKQHGTLLRKEFKNVKLVPEIDTAIAAEKMHQGEYPENSLVIAPTSCAKIYRLKVYIKDIPTNRGYLTKIYLVKKKDD
ncbi:hypothetical protein HZA42_05810 [Candidatus Peregrinibacteria bacterium]|nr:hypothetical protein [Candidatus Peregrinibacteria bacterium]